MRVDIPDELVEQIEKIISSSKLEWLQYESVQDFVIDAVKRRASELTWGPANERRSS